MLLALVLSEFAWSSPGESAYPAKPAGLAISVSRAPPRPIENPQRADLPDTSSGLAARDWIMEPLGEFELITHAYGVHLPRKSPQLQEPAIPWDIGASLLPAGFTPGPVAAHARAEEDGSYSPGRLVLFLVLLLMPAFICGAVLLALLVVANSMLPRAAEPPVRSEYR